MRKKVARFIRYGGCVFEYSHAKHNILTYIMQPAYYYDDWQDDGGLLVVEYHPERKGHEYLVLHYIGVNQRNGYISHNNISKRDKIAKPVEEKQ